MSRSQRNGMQRLLHAALAQSPGLTKMELAAIVDCSPVQANNALHLLQKRGCATYEATSERGVGLTYRWYAKGELDSVSRYPRKVEDAHPLCALWPVPVPSAYEDAEA